MPTKQAIQAPEITKPLTSYALKKSVTATADRWTRNAPSLHTQNGARKFLTLVERRRALSNMRGLPKARALYAEVLAYSGARPSEVLALNARSFDLDRKLVTIVTLKRRAFFVREVPLPDQLLRALDRCFSLRRVQHDDARSVERLWPFCRMTAWRIINAVMRAAGIAGPQACSRGFRHCFGHGHCRHNTPLHIIQRWLGHAQLSTTAIYMGLSGSEERHFARRLWGEELGTCA